MKFNYVITFHDGRRSQAEFSKEKKEVIKDISKHYKKCPYTTYNNYDIWNEDCNYSVESRYDGDWCIYNYEVERKVLGRFKTLGSALNKVEKLLNNP